MSKLIPEPHLQKAFIRKNITWAETIAEMIDNAFDKDAGNATEVDIGLYRDEIVVLDNGRGVADINRLGRLGDSASYLHEGNVGQFGVGGKGWYSKCSALMVNTVCEGVHHLHEFDLNAKPGEWLDAYEGTGRKHKGASYTSLHLHGFWEKPLIFVEALKKELEILYWPALDGTRSINIHDFRKNKDKPEVWTLDRMSPPKWSDRLTFESEAGGKKYKATIGILSEGIGKYSGLFMGFLFRNIYVEKSLGRNSLPARIHGQIELSGDWRHALSEHKNAISVGYDELLRDIHKHSKEIIARANEYSEDIRLENVKFEIETNFDRAMKDRGGTLKLVTDSGRGDLDEIKSRKPPKEEGVAKPEGEKPRLTMIDGDSEKKKVGGLSLAFVKMGHDTLGEVRVSDRGLRVELNIECPKINALSKQPRYPGLYLVIGNELAMYAMTLSESRDIREEFGPMLGNATNSEHKHEMARAIRVWWGFLAAESGSEREDEKTA